MAGGVGELLCLGSLLVTGLASGAPLPPGTHSSLLEFDTWRLALSSLGAPTEYLLGANNWLENLHKLQGCYVSKAYWFSTNAGQKLWDLKMTPGAMAFLWHPSDERFSKSHLEVAKRKWILKIELKLGDQLHPAG